MVARCVVVPGVGAVPGLPYPWQRTGLHTLPWVGGGGRVTCTMVKVDWRYVRLYHNQMNNNNTQLKEISSNRQIISTCL